MDTPTTHPSDTCNASSAVLDNLLSSKTATALGGLTLGLALCLGLPGNAFVVWTVLRRTRSRSVTCLLILNLAVADGITLLTAPFWIHFLLAQDWAFGQAACKLFHFVCCLNMYASIFLITSMSVDRLLAVVRPFSATLLRRKARAFRLLLGLWALATVAALPVAYYRQVRVGSIHCRRICEPVHPGPGHLAFHYLMETGLGFLLPLGVLSVCYAVVGRRVRALRPRGRSRLGCLVAALVLTFALFWTPYHVVNLAQVGAELTARERVEGLLKEARPVVTSLAFFSCGVNPILYAFSGLELIRTAGPNFMARLFEATVADPGPGRLEGGSRPEVGLGQAQGASGAPVSG